MSSEFNADSAKFKLELDAENFQRNTKRAKETFAEFADKTTANVQAVRQQFSNYLVNDLAGNAIKAAFEKSFEFVANFANESKELVKIADAFNMPVEAISELQAVANGAEVDLGALADAANALNFDALEVDAAKFGLNLDDLKSKDSAERLTAVLDALNKLPDATERANYATRLFGDAAAALNPILDGARGSTQEFIDAAKEAGLIANDASARGAAEFADALTQLKDAATGAANAFASVLLPAFKEGADILTEVARAFGGVLAPVDDASKELDRVAASMTAAREKGDELRKLDAEKFKFAEDLAGQGTLIESTFNKAASIIEELQTRYGDLGFTVDKAARSISIAAGAQERFNASAKENERVEIEREIAATENRERDLQARSQKKLEAFDSFGARLASMPRNYANYFTGGVVESTSEKWSKEIEEIGDEILVERKKLTTLRQRLKTLNEQDAETNADAETPLHENPTIPTANNPQNNVKLVETENGQEINAAPSRIQTDKNGNPGENKPKEAEKAQPYPVPIEIPEFNPTETPVESSPKSRQAEPAFEPSPSFEPKQTPVESSPKSRQAEPAFEPSPSFEPKQTPVESSPKSRQAEPTFETSPSFEAKQTPVEPSAPPRQSTQAQKLDAEIARFETQIRRAEQTAEENRIEDVKKEEFDYRQKLETRIVEERSKGKSGQDAALIGTLQQKIEESTTREAERVELIEQEIDERKREEAEKARQEGGVPENILATPLEGQEAALSEGADELTRIIAERLEEGEEPTLDDDLFAELLEYPDYFERAYQAAEETAKGTAPTFSAFDAANAADAQNGEKALKEAERQTRVLENIERALKDRSATFA